MSEPYQGDQDGESFFATMRTPGRFSYSKPFSLVRQFEDGPAGAVGETARYAYQVVDPDAHFVVSAGKGYETIVRTTPSRQQIKALFLEESRVIRTLLLQRFNASGKALKDGFTLTGAEIDTLRDFLRLVETTSLLPAEGSRLSPAMMRDLLSDPGTAAMIYGEKRDEIYSLIENDIQARDVVAIKRRRASLDKYDKMLSDPEYFQELRAEGGGGHLKPEDVWQHFFENNRWMFGLGLAAQVLLSWADGKLEQTIVGRSIAKVGKRVDGLLHSSGALNSICLVEIKRHDTALLDEHEYRTGAWQASEELAGAIAQCHANVDSMILEHHRLTQTDTQGYETGKTAYVCRPRSYLVIGSLTQFMRNGQVNERKFRSFENLRRSLSDPEIITFDELRERAANVLSGLEA